MKLAVQLYSLRHHMENGENFIDILRKVKASLKFLGKLIGAENKVSLGNRELANADQAVHLAAVLVSEKGRGLAETHGKVSV